MNSCKLVEHKIKIIKSVHCYSKQQPGRYLCVDTRKDQVFAPKLRPNSSYARNCSAPNTRSKHFNKDVQHNVPIKKSLRTVQNRVSTQTTAFW